MDILAFSIAALVGGLIGWPLGKRLARWAKEESDFNRRLAEWAERR